MKRAASLILTLLALSLWWLTPAQASSTDLGVPCGILVGHHCSTVSVTLSGNGTGIVQTTDFSWTAPNNLITCNRSGGLTTGLCVHRYDVIDSRGLVIAWSARPAMGSLVCDPACQSGPINLAGKAGGSPTYDYAFSLTGPITVQVSTSGSGSGIVTSEPIGIVCATTCSDVFGAGLPLTLTAKPSSGSLFAGWSSGLCVGQAAACGIAPNASVDVVATFAGAPTARPTSKSTATARATLTPAPTPTLAIVSAAPVVTTGSSLAPVAIAANPSASSGPSVQPVATSSGSDLTPAAIVIAAIVLAVGIGSGLAIGLRRRQA